MATIYSAQLASVRAGKRAESYHDVNGKSLVWNVVLAAQAGIGDLIVLGHLPQNAILKGGRESHSAMGASATGAISLYLVADPATYELGAAVASSDLQAAVTYTSAGTNTFGLTEATLLYYVTPSPVLVVTTIAGAVFPAAGTLKGHLDYAVAH